MMRENNKAHAFEFLRKSVPLLSPSLNTVMLALIGRFEATISRWLAAILPSTAPLPVSSCAVSAYTD